MSVNLSIVRPVYSSPVFEMQVAHAVRRAFLLDPIKVSYYILDRCHYVSKVKTPTGVSVGLFLSQNKDRKMQTVTSIGDLTLEGDDAGLLINVMGNEVELLDKPSDLTALKKIEIANKYLRRKFSGVSDNYTKTPSLLDTFMLFPENLNKVGTVERIALLDAYIIETSNK